MLLERMLLRLSINDQAGQRSGNQNRSAASYYTERAGDKQEQTLLECAGRAKAATALWIRGFEDFPKRRRAGKRTKISFCLRVFEEF